MMKYKYRMGSGLAFTPEKDMKMLEAMGKRGYVLEKLTGMGFIYRFKKSDPEDKIYTWSAEKTLTQDYLAFFMESGWHPVIAFDGVQIFKANPETVNAHTDCTSITISLEEQIKIYSKYTMYTGLVLFVLLLLSTPLFYFRWLGLLTMFLGISAFIVCFFPLLGFIYRKWKMSK